MGHRGEDESIGGSNCQYPEEQSVAAPSSHVQGKPRRKGLAGERIASDWLGKVTLRFLTPSQDGQKKDSAIALMPWQGKNRPARCARLKGTPAGAPRGEQVTEGEGQRDTEALRAKRWRVPRGTRRVRNRTGRGASPEAAISSRPIWNIPGHIVRRNLGTTRCRRASLNPGTVGTEDRFPVDPSEASGRTLSVS